MMTGNLAPIEYAPSVFSSFVVDTRPSMKVPGILIGSEGQLVLRAFEWPGRLNYYNARKETCERKGSSWYKLYLSSRAVVPVAGFWEKAGYFSADNLFFLAAIRQESNLSIITVPADEQVAKFHHRMPLQIMPDNIRVWLAAA